MKRSRQSSGTRPQKEPAPLTSTALLSAGLTVPVSPDTSPRIGFLTTEPNAMPAILTEA